jgi:hypothetical protein
MVVVKIFNFQCLVICNIYSFCLSLCKCLIQNNLHFWFFFLRVTDMINSYLLLYYCCRGILFVCLLFLYRLSLTISDAPLYFYSVLNALGKALLGV